MRKCSPHFLDMIELPTQYSRQTPGWGQCAWQIRGQLSLQLDTSTRHPNNIVVQQFIVLSRWRGTRVAAHMGAAGEHGLGGAFDKQEVTVALAAAHAHHLPVAAELQRAHLPRTVQSALLFNQLGVTASQCHAPTALTPRLLARDNQATPIRPDGRRQPPEHKCLSKSIQQEWSTTNYGARRPWMHARGLRSQAGSLRLLPRSL